MVLVGGPDAERAISLMSGTQVQAALIAAGHEVLLRDVGPTCLSCLDEFVGWGGQVVFPALHGSWGEGGPLQQVLVDRGLSFVGSEPEAADRCMDKDCTKAILASHGLPVPKHEMVGPEHSTTMGFPVVVKAPCEGSSIDLVVCRHEKELNEARLRLHRRHANLMIETYVDGRELTFGVLGDFDGDHALPGIHIVPATPFYDYEAKYERDDTQYHFDLKLPTDLVAQLEQLSVRCHQVLGCRHMSRVDILLDGDQSPWILEVNTIPGFTGHSLIPMAAVRAGISLPQLVDRLVRMAQRDCLADRMAGGAKLAAS